MKQLLKRWIPQRLQPPLRKCWRVGKAVVRRMHVYDERVQQEIDVYTDVENVHDLPPIAHYWSTKYLVPMLQPFGFANSTEFFRSYIGRFCRECPAETVQVLSIGAGDSASEINIAEWLREFGIENFKFECLDINPALFKRAEASARAKNLSRHFTFTTFDINSWRPQRQYRVILAIQSLHHVLELEILFDKVSKALHPDGFFMTDDMIGRNGHQRWPEALKFVEQIWSELPERYKYNHGLKRIENIFENSDCSTLGFEGIRAQDILPMLVRRFDFDLFVAFGNILDVFIDRNFGPNFDPANPWDRAFIDRVHALDVEQIESGNLKPTHVMAAMTKKPAARTAIYKHLTPEFCFRWPESRLARRWKALFRRGAEVV